MESVLAAANADVLASGAADAKPYALSATLLAEAQQVQTVGDELGSVPLPAVAVDVRLQLRSLVEDLLLGCQQLSTLLQETAEAVTQETVNFPLGLDGAMRVGYSPRAQGVAALLRRAQAWLQTIDHETNSQARLPGFEAGALSLDAQRDPP
jgi:hypothetical protein